MTRRRYGVKAWTALVAIAVAAGGCARKTAGQAEAHLEPAVGEIWLTERQLAEGKIVVEPLVYHDVDDIITASGKVVFDDTQVGHVFSPVAGRITRVDVQLGQRVKKGDILAVLESPDIGIASADLHKAEADRIAAEHDLQRQKELLTAHATSQRDYEQAEDAYRKAKAEVERAKQKARLFRTGGSGGVSQTYAIRSAVDGEIVARNVVPGAEVQGHYGGGAVQELFTVGELDRLWVLADVYEIDVQRVKVGSPVSIKLFSMPQRSFAAKIDWIPGALDSLTRTAKVRCVLDNKERLLMPEMFATVFISVDQRKAIAIPRTALVRIGEQTNVFTETGRAPDGRYMFMRTPVSVDETEGGQWLPVSRGVELGTRVVTQGAILLAGER